MTRSPPVAPLPPRRQLDGLEACRGVAATMVVLYHASNHLARNVGFKPLGGLMQFGHAGVDFFFVLSGFIIWFVHAGDLGHPSRLLHYLQRRFTRIYPIYWFVTLSSLALGGLLSTHAQPVLKALQDASLWPTVGEPYIGVAWTLQYEVLFYVLFAIAIVDRRAGVAVFTAWLGSIVATRLFGLAAGDSALLLRLASVFNLEFFFGMFAAWLVRAGHDRHPRVLLATGAALFAIAAVFEDLGRLDGFQAAARFAYGLPSVLLVIGASGLSRTRSLLSRGLMVLGSASYSIYLTHLLFIGIVYKASEITGLFARLPPTAMWAVMSAAGVSGGIAVSRWVEYPLMARVRERLTARRAPHPA